MSGLEFVVCVFVYLVVAGFLVGLGKNEVDGGHVVLTAMCWPVLLVLVPFIGVGWVVVRAGRWFGEYIAERGKP